MSDAAFVTGFLLATVAPGAVAGWAVRRWIPGRAGNWLAAVAMLGAAWLGMGAFLSFALAGFSVAMD